MVNVGPQCSIKPALDECFLLADSFRIRGRPPSVAALGAVLADSHYLGAISAPTLRHLCAISASSLRHLRVISASSLRNLSLVSVAKAACARPSSWLMSTWS